jgi:hypothetical protein
MVGSGVVVLSGAGRRLGISAVKNCASLGISLLRVSLARPVCLAGRAAAWLSGCLRVRVPYVGGRWAGRPRSGNLAQNGHDVLCCAVLCCVHLRDAAAQALADWRAVLWGTDAF